MVWLKLIVNAVDAADPGRTFDDLLVCATNRQHLWVGPV
jgi:hypothetical protein